MHLFGVVFKVPKSVLERSLKMYMADPEVRAATMIGIVDENRELDKWQVLKGLRKLENSIHATE
jgi:hypothetical protein